MAQYMPGKEFADEQDYVIEIVEYDYTDFVAINLTGQGFILSNDPDKAALVHTGINLPYDQAIAFAEEILMRAGKPVQR
jgi:hypothetical protein